MMDEKSTWKTKTSVQKAVSSRFIAWLYKYKTERTLILKPLHSINRADSYEKWHDPQLSVQISHPAYKIYFAAFF